jgi:glutathione S-transferase
MNTFGWVNALRFSGVDIDNFPSLKAWWERILARPAVVRGLSVPERSPMGNDLYMNRRKDDKEFAEKEDKVYAEVKAAKEKYNYKYSSP